LKTLEEKQESKDIKKVHLGQKHKEFNLEGHQIFLVIPRVIRGVSPKRQRRNERRTSSAGMGV